MPHVRVLRSTAAAAVLGLLAFGSEAQAIPYTVGDTLQVTFTESGPARVFGGLVTGVDGRYVDTLAFSETDNLGPPAQGVAKLYNGNTLLGSVNFTAWKLQFFSFVAPGDPFTFNSVGTVNDWSSLIDGTIDGRLDITFNTDFDVTIGLAGFGVGQFASQIANADTQPTITGQRVIAATPLPATLPLFVSGLGLLGFAARRRKAASATA